MFAIINNMQIKVRHKDDHTVEEKGIPVWQQSAPTDDEDKLRIFFIMPVQYEGGGYCDVEIALKEDDEWLLVGKSNEYSSNHLVEKDLPIIDEQTKENIFLVWDDGSRAHKENARRLYLTFHDQIKAFAP